MTMTQNMADEVAGGVAELAQNDDLDDPTDADYAAIAEAVIEDYNDGKAVRDQIEYGIDRVSVGESSDTVRVWIETDVLPGGIVRRFNDADSMTLGNVYSAAADTVRFAVRLRL